MSAPDPQQLTLREAFENHYDHECQPTTVGTYEAVLRMWERLTDDPPITEITNATVAEFRAGCLEHEYKPRTINSSWGRLRTILRRFGPVTDGNPWALELIGRVPAMRPVKVVHRRPYRIPLDDLTRFYVACKHADYPRVGLSASDWWRGLIVVCYLTALRKSDLAAMTWEQLDLDEGTMDFTSRKTGKADLWPLHPVAISHLKRIHRPAGRVFPGLAGTGSRLSQRFRHLRSVAGVNRFTLHDIRRTAASELERVGKGLGAEFLQHAPHDVSDVSYLNRFDELKEALERMRLPTGFRSGPKMAEREFEKERQERIRLQSSDFKARTKPPSEDWTFHAGGFTFRGTDYRMEYSTRLKLLKLIATSERPVTRDEVAAMLGSPKGGTSTRRIHVHVSGLRKRLRLLFGLPETFNPLPCVSRGDGGAWTITVP